jgi:hypothetical protein
MSKQTNNNQVAELEKKLKSSLRQARQTSKGWFVICDQRDAAFQIQERYG